MTAQKINAAGIKRRSHSAPPTGDRCPSALPKFESCVPGTYDANNGSILAGDEKKPRITAGISAVKISLLFFAIKIKVSLINNRFYLL